MLCRVWISLYASPVSRKMASASAKIPMACSVSPRARAVCPSSRSATARPRLSPASSYSRTDCSR
ncbi:hypothetical protein STENM327S_00743 [Streptomyces tendae]